MTSLAHCIFENCESVNLRAQGYCSKHYQKLRREGALTIREPGRKPCTVDGCRRMGKARGWCHTHYKRWQAHGTVEWVSHKTEYVSYPKTWTKEQKAEAKRAKSRAYIQKNAGRYRDHSRKRRAIISEVTAETVYLEDVTAL